MSVEVAIIMGSKSDWDVMKNASDLLTEFNIEHESKVLSAHRTPLQVKEYIDNSHAKVFIAGAGAAAHLAGAIAAHTLKPVLGVPLDATSFNGLDALLSTVQMPAGIPVATFAVGKAGAINAAIFAASVLAPNNAEVAKHIAAHRKSKADKVLGETLS